MKWGKGGAERSQTQAPAFPARLGRRLNSPLLMQGKEDSDLIIVSETHNEYADMAGSV